MLCKNACCSSLVEPPSRLGCGQHRCGAAGAPQAAFRRQLGRGGAAAVLDEVGDFALHLGERAAEAAAAADGGGGAGRCGRQRGRDRRGGKLSVAHRFRLRRAARAASSVNCSASRLPLRVVAPLQATTRRSSSSQAAASLARAGSGWAAMKPAIVASMPFSARTRATRCLRRASIASSAGASSSARAASSRALMAQRGLELALEQRVDRVRRHAGPGRRRRPVRPPPAGGSCGSSAASVEALDQAGETAGVEGQLALGQRVAQFGHAGGVEVGQGGQRLGGRLQHARLQGRGAFASRQAPAGAGAALAPPIAGVIVGAPVPVIFMRLPRVFD